MICCEIFSLHWAEVREITVQSAKVSRDDSSNQIAAISDRRHH